MSQFTALIWDSRNDRATAAAGRFVQKLCASSSEWQPTLNASGLVILHKGVVPGAWQPHVLQDAVGVVFGKLFSQRYDSDGYSSIGALNRSESAKIVCSKTRHLVDNYWGRYIAIVRDTNTQATWILRDPQGGKIPCMQTCYEEVQIFFSNMEECIPQGLMRFTINEAQLAAHVVDVSLGAHASALNEISFVIPGECVTVHRNATTTREQYWDPVEIATSNVIEDIEEAAREARRVTQYCVWSWARDHKRILHHLSGGLDSAVVLSCLASAPTKPLVICLNTFERSTYGDERRFARLAAEHAGCKLFELENQTSDIGLEYLRNLKRRPRPENYQGPLENTEARRAIAREWQLEASFDGSMGDPLFYNLEPRLIAYDYLRYYGIGRGAIQSAAAVARVTGGCAWTVLASAVGTCLFPRLWKVQSLAGVGERLVKPEIIEVVRRSNQGLHPWLKNRNRVPPGKQYQIKMLSFTFEYHVTDAEADYEPDIYIQPLLSQPLVELCLRIPTFVHSPFGVGRVTERKAFAESVPLEIIERTTKGAVHESMTELVESNLPVVREFMRESWLINNGFLDRHKVDGVLSAENRLHSEGITDLLRFLEIEAWVRNAS